MYYSKQSNLNNDYYNAYDYSNEEKEKENILNTIIKILAIILLLTFIIFGYIFISKEGKLEQALMKKTILTTEVINENRAENIEASKDLSTLNNQEILKIVKMVMKQMNQEREDNQNSTAFMVKDDDHYAKVLMNQEIDEISNSIKKNKVSNINSQKVAGHTPTLKEKNHYNKVIIEEEEMKKKGSLAQLSNALSSEISQMAEVPEVSYYTKSISKELNVRSNEMRVIIVEKGDTLSKIAFKAYGDYDAYPKILLANPEVIVNPNQIFVGQHLHIPL